MKLAHLALIVALIVPPALAQAPLPPDVNVLPPAVDVPKELAAYSGKWTGQWGQTLDHVLVVEKVEGRHAFIIYSWGAAPSWGINRASFERVKAEFRDDGSLRAKFPNGAWVTYKMSADGRSLDGEYALGRITRGVFKREE